jgi:hypothetical protein
MDLQNFTNLRHQHRRDFVPSLVPGNLAVRVRVEIAAA